MNEKFQLNQDQTDGLFALCRAKNVPYLDVQYELVDHLASSIEATMIQNPSFTYETALQAVLSKYPITGFYYFVEQKEKGLTKYWRIRIWKILLSYMKPPKVVAVFAAVVLNYWVLQLTGKMGMFFILGALFLATIAVNIHLSSLLKEERVRSEGTFFEKFIEDENKYKYLFLQTLKRMFSKAGFPTAFILFQYDVLDVTFTNGHVLFISVLFSLTAIWLHSCWIYIPQMLFQEIDKKYKHLNIHLST